MNIQEKTMKHEWVISVQGQRAVDAGYKFQQDHWCRCIYDHGEKIAQLQVVLDSDLIYKGLASKWVDVILYKWEYADAVLSQLERLGFKGCLCAFYDEADIFGTRDNTIFFHL